MRHSTRVFYSLKVRNPLYLKEHNDLNFTEVSWRIFSIN